MSKGNVAFALATIAGILFAPTVPAATITVSGGCTLDSAITSANTDAASGGCPAGSGADTIELTTNVTLTTVAESYTYFIYDGGDSGLPVVRTPITIDGGGHQIARSATAPQFRVLTVSAYDSDSGALTLRDVTIAGGDVDNYGTFFNGFNEGFNEVGGGVASFWAPVSIENSLLEGNAADTGGAVGILGGELTVFNSEFNENFAEARGGAIYHLNNSGAADIHRSRFSDNDAGASGGAITLGYFSSMVVRDSAFYRNRAVAGGAIRGDGSLSDLRVTNGLFQDNVATDLGVAPFAVNSKGGGAVSVFNASGAEIRNSALLQNRAEVFSIATGGALRAEGSGAAISLIDSEVTGNVSGNAYATDGGGIGVAPGGGIVVRGSTIDGNTAAGEGGGIYAWQAHTISISASTINGNTAELWRGGGVYAYDGDLDVAASDITGNTAKTTGGGVYFSDGSGLRNLLTLRDSLVSGNMLLSPSIFSGGAGIHIENYTDALIERSSILGNATAGNFGGGVHVSVGVTDVDIVNSTISGNAAGYGGGIEVNGSGGISLDLVHTTVVGNSANQGGGMRDGVGHSTLQASIFADNTSPDGPNCRTFGAIGDNGDNFADDASCGAGISVVTDPELDLGALSDNGGRTPTILPGLASVVVDSTGTDCLAVGGVDQRGAPRDGNCDAGAVEAGLDLPVIGFETSGTLVTEGTDTGFDVAVRLDNTLGNIDSGEVLVWVALKGSAAYDYDYDLTDETTPTVIPVPEPGTTETALLEFDLFDDDELEGAETLALSFVFAGPAGAGAITEHEVTIFDDESTASACAELQAELQAQMGDEDPAVYRNHGRYVSPVAKATSQALKRGEITLECQGCIVNQFARSVPIAEQQICGGSPMLIGVRP